MNENINPPCRVCGSHNHSTVECVHASKVPEPPAQSLPQGTTDTPETDAFKPTPLHSWCNKARSLEGRLILALERAELFEGAVEEWKNDESIRNDDLHVSLAALQRENEGLREELALLNESLPKLSGKTKNTARELLGEVLRHITDEKLQASHGCVEVTNAVNVVERLIADNNSLRADLATKDAQIETLKEKLGTARS